MRVTLVAIFVAGILGVFRDQEVALPMGLPAPTPAWAPWGMPQYPELIGPNVVTFPVSGDFTIAAMMGIFLLGLGLVVRRLGGRR